MNNQELRKLAAEKDVKLWQIADEIEIADTTFSKWMRKELSEDKKKRVYEAIHAISTKQEAGQ